MYAVEYLRSRFRRHMETFYGYVRPVDFTAVQKLLGGARTYYYDAVNYAQGRDEEKDAFEARAATRETEHRYINSLPGFTSATGSCRHGFGRSARGC